ncbi:hypothetical protein [Paenibacillus sp. LHD-38]|uniref:hypothetical protein n=1 Tax=Paenibacillus sp. LHD-38 TaxID=3072143 RepID=UPI00280ECA31|nr:hypothetical protein [Paenibacillus sp. LHD-38]MDQ8735309.1 hypothetical protein [Paenibacillus sp. LHD-38]
MDQQSTRAKQLFTDHYGNYFQMHREGNYEEYKTYEITKEQEVAWYEELIEKNAGELSFRNWDAAVQLLAIAKNYPDSRILERVIAFAARHVMSSDSIVKLMYAEHIIEIIKLVKSKAEIDMLHRAYKTAAQILDDIMSKPLIIDPGHDLQSLSLKDKKSLNHRAAKNIEVIKELLASDK